jgi:hypothetical protein
MGRRLALVALVLLPVAGLLLLHNHAVTHRWTTMPYQLSRYQYGVPATFTIQPNPVPHRELTAEQELDYRAQSIIHGDGPETLGSCMTRWVERLHFYRFFFLAPLYLALPAFLLALREPRYRWVLLTIVVFSLGTNFYPYFYPHYIAVLTCLFVLVSVAALERIARWRIAAVLILGLCGVEFLFWYALHAWAPDPVLNAWGQHEGGDYINHGDDEGRIAVNRQLAASPGKQLVFVRYGPRHAFHEWIHNDADIDRARVVWAADMGSDINEFLRHYYPDRMAWLVEPDAEPPRLTLYTGPSVPEPVPPAAPAQPTHEAAPPLRFDDGLVNNPGGIQEVRKKR